MRIENLKILSEMLDKLDNKSTMEDLMQSVRAIVELFAKMKHANESERQEIRDLFETLRKDSRLGTVADLQKNFAKLESAISKRMAEIKDGAPGKDADVDLIIAELKDSLPKVEDFMKHLPEYGTDIRDGLELLNGGDRLSMKAIDGLLEALEELKKLRTGTIINGGGGNASGGRIVKVYDLSSQLNGILKTFSLPAFWRVISVQSSSFPNAFRPTTDYTTDASAMTITFTSEITASSTLAAGQTIIVIYSEA